MKKRLSFGFGRKKISLNPNQTLETIPSTKVDTISLNFESDLPKDYPRDHLFEKDDSIEDKPPQQNSPKCQKVFKDRIHPKIIVCGETWKSEAKEHYGLSEVHEVLDCKEFDQLPAEQTDTFQPFQQKGLIKSLHYSQKNELLITGGTDKLVKLWTLNEKSVGSSFDEMCELKGHSDWVNCVSLDKNGKWAISGSRDASIRFWAPKDNIFGEWKGLNVIEKAHGSVEFVNCCDTNFGDVALTGGSDWMIRLWDVFVGKEKCKFTSMFGHSYSVTAIKTHPNDPNVFASGGEDSKVALWDIRVDNKSQVIEEHTGPINGIVFDPTSDGPNWLASCGGDGYMNVYDIRTWKLYATLQEPPVKAENGGGYLAESTRNELNPKLLSERCSDRRSNEFSHPIISCSVSTDPKDDRNCYLSSGGRDKVIRTWKYTKGRTRIDESCEKWACVGFIRTNLNKVNCIGFVQNL
mmetsp:Transcript_19942/g.29504  ORF Transcript_19942/g.29504 Transcript_19942/m.29504 type:complete len:464 (+) Transcript_19942:46-1437(+)